MSNDCEHFLDQLLSSLDEPLEAPARAAFEAHLAACPPCAARLKEHVVLREALRDLNTEPVYVAPFTDDQVSKFVGAMRAERRRDASGNARTG